MNVLKKLTEESEEARVVQSRDPLDHHGPVKTCALCGAPLWSRHKLNCIYAKTPGVG